ncbi:MAG TPA: hypothetical protein VFQ46_09260 [Candidatus Limnocylindria bacterium]|nr:hypothetical protein [Candidatus Limnocylindria bacterium]
MSWNRTVRLPATISLTLALALGALAAPALVTAKPAPLQFGVGTGFDTTKTTGAMPQMVSPGSTVAFEVWARNVGGSNISKLFLTARTAAAFDSVTVINDGNTAGSCGAGPGAGIALQCKWKPFKPGASTRVRLILTAPASGSSLPVNFEWSSTGFVPGGNNSHGDLFTKNDSAAVNGDIDSFAGRWVKAGSANLVVQTNPNLSNGNPQSTKVNSPTDAIPVTAAEDPDLSDCQAEFEGCFGQASVLNVNDGATFPGGFTVEVVYLGEFPYADFIHFFDNGESEDLDPCGEEPEAPCFDLTVDEGFTYVTFYLLQNGKTFGH